MQHATASQRTVVYNSLSDDHADGTQLISDLNGRPQAYTPVFYRLSAFPPNTVHPFAEHTVYHIGNASNRNKWLTDWLLNIDGFYSIVF